VLRHDLRRLCQGAGFPPAPQAKTVRWTVFKESVYDTFHTLHAATYEVGAFLTYQPPSLATNYNNFNIKKTSPKHKNAPTIQVGAF